MVPADLSPYSQAKHSYDPHLAVAKNTTSSIEGKAVGASTVPILELEKCRFN